MNFGELGKIALKLTMYGLEDMGLGDCLYDVKNIVDSCEVIYKSSKKVAKKMKKKNKKKKDKEYRYIFKNKDYDF